MSVTKTVDVGGMHCASCVQRVENQLSKVPGVVQASVNLVLNQARVEIDGVVEDRDLHQAIERAGYTVEGIYSERKTSKSDVVKRQDISTNRIKQALFLSLPFTVLVVAASMTLMFNPTLLGLHTAEWNTVLFALTLPVLWAGRMFYIGAWKSMLHGSATMDTLVSIGTLAAFIYSTFLTFRPEGLFAGESHAGAYFDTASVIITLILLGKWLEARAKGKTAEALHALLELAPPTARVRRNGEEVDVDASNVIVNDTVIVLPGTRIPVDGVVISGFSSVDESMITGESSPNEKGKDAVLTGGTLNGNGTLVMRAAAVGSDTVLAGIIRSVESAQASKAPIQHLADRISSVFVPIVIVIAVVTFVVWMLASPADAPLAMALTTSISVLIIACPCALGLATPAAIIVGSGAAAKRGILFSNAEALQKLSEATRFVFDKTGTITHGTPKVVNVEYSQTFENTAALRWQRTDAATALWELVHSVQRRSEHPLAKCFTNYHPNGEAIGTTEPESTEAIPGKGVVGTVGKHKVRIGNESLMTDAMLLIDSNLENYAAKWSEQGVSPNFVAIDGMVLAAVGTADTIRPASADIIKNLKNRGYSVSIITGDKKATAQAIARQVGIDEVIAEVLPADKAAAIENLQRRGEQVVMVGDGINDAPGLAQADVGVAVGGGTDIAKSTADVTLVRNDISSLIDAIDVSKTTMKTVRQNLFLAFLYNTLGIPIAAGILAPFTGWLLSPIIAATAMALSSVTVVSNALRLKRML
ncbi:MAG: copper-translocating P-type ATPase [Ignavibacteria bacterium]|nr:copper-translocating P-type ATPase [Ignavibacteria bacterium]